MGVNKSVLMLCIASPILSYVLDTHRYQILHYSKSFISFLVRPCPDSFQPENSRAELFLLITGMHDFSRLLLLSDTRNDVMQQSSAVPMAVSYSRCFGSMYVPCNALIGRFK
jgi:hypothetical protein